MTDQIYPAWVSTGFVLGKCDYFASLHLWPLQSEVNPRRWLENFQDSELEHAVHLLNSFMYFSDELVVELLKAAFQSLSKFVVRASQPYIQADSQWRQFRKKLVVTYVTGEKPSETDSGYIFARLARQVLGIPEKRIMSPDRVLEMLVSQGPRPVVFVDDFVGSGDQCVKTWYREVTLPSGTTTSFEKYSAVTGSRFFYCPLVCAEQGRQEVISRCPLLVLSPAHFLSTRYSVLASDSLVWPERLRSSAIDFLRAVSRRAGIAESRWAGYKSLGLTLAFEHGVPNATLPVFYHEEGGWYPLVRGR